ncbi:expressed unknown protein (Partial), partial [Seminavis robusta]|eukprot:Sro1251_g256110.1 n/a (105) ;mRNA; r:2-316
MAPRIADEPSRSLSHAAAVAAQVEAARSNTSPPPATPPPMMKPERQESALRRLGRRLRRRSLSAPPSLSRGRSSLLEEHFCVEKEENTNKVVAVLPGVPKHPENW